VLTDDDAGVAAMGFNRWCMGVNSFVGEDAMVEGVAAKGKVVLLVGVVVGGSGSGSIIMVMDVVRVVGGGCGVKVGGGV
jgi:hypothetical protein